MPQDLRFQRQPNLRFEKWWWEAVSTAEAREECCARRGRRFKIGVADRGMKSYDELI